MGFYRSEGDPHVKDGVILPDGEVRPASLAGIIPIEIPTVPYVGGRESMLGAAIMTAGEDPAVVITSQETEVPVSVG